MDRKTWYGLDLFKICAAVLIVFMHTYNADLGIAGSWIKNVLSSACVPFFFLVSGFLFRHGIERSMASGGKNEEQIWFKRYILRLIRMYIAWSVFTIPVAIMVVNRGHPEFGFFLKALYHLRLFVLTGSIGIYWYLLALILSAVIIRWFYARKRLGLLLFFSLIVYLWGCAYDSPLNRQQLYFEVIHVVFGSTRNFLNVGLPFMLVGFLFPASKATDVPTRRMCLMAILFILSILIRSFEVFYLKTSVSTALVAIAAFLFALSLDCGCLARVSMNLRKLSIGMYLLHFPFILVFDYYLNKGTLLDFPITLGFSIVTYYAIRRMAPHVSAILFGYPSTRELLRYQP